MNDNKDMDFIDPRSPINKIDDDIVLYAVNNCDSNVVLTDGTNTATLTTPGHPGSIQVISRDMLKSPGIMGLWSTDRIRISTSAEVGQRAVSSIQLRAEKEKAHKEEINRIIVESKDVAEGGLGKQTDESFKARNIVDSDSVAKQIAEDGPEVDGGAEETGTQNEGQQAVDAEKRPVKGRRGRKKTEDN